MGKYKSLLGTILGTMLTGFGIGVFLTPNKIITHKKNMSNIIQKK